MAHDIHGTRVPGPAPRVLVLRGPGRPLGPLMMPSAEPWRPEVDIRTVRTPRLLPGPRASRACQAAIRHDSYAMVHVTEARLAPLAALLRRRLGVPASADVLPQDVTALRSTSLVRAMQRLDQLFVCDELTQADLRVRGVRVPAALVPPSAAPLREPSPHVLTAVIRALRGVEPGRLVVGLPWPQRMEELRWFRDAVLARLAAAPVCLLFGVRERRSARRVLNMVGAPDVRIMGGNVETATIAAAGRCVDAFITASPGGWEAGGVQGLLDMAVSGAPLVAAGGDPGGVLRDERNAFLVRRGDDAAFVSTLDRLLALPAAQRHSLGQEFARYTLDRWPLGGALSVYAERFSALVGRPAIPGELRAA